MTTIRDMLDDNPKSADLLRVYIRQTYLTNDPDETGFVSYIETFTVDNERIAMLLQDNYRFLFEFFDTNDLIISVVYDGEHKVFRYRVDQKDVVNQHEIESNDFSTRKEAEAEAVNYSFKTLEAILCETK